MTADRVVPELSKFGGHILRTLLSKDAEARLQAALDGAVVAEPILTETPQPTV